MGTGGRATSHKLGAHESGVHLLEEGAMDAGAHFNVFWNIHQKASC